MLFITRPKPIPTTSGPALRVIGKSWYPWRYLLPPTAALFAVVGIILVIFAPKELMTKESGEQKDIRERPTALIVLLGCTGSVLLFISMSLCGKIYAIYEYTNWESHPAKKVESRTAVYSVGGNADIISLPVTTITSGEPATGRSVLPPEDDPGLHSPPSRPSPTAPISRFSSITETLRTEDSESPASAATDNFDDSASTLNSIWTTMPSFDGTNKGQTSFDNPPESWLSLKNEAAENKETAHPL